MDLPHELIRFSSDDRASVQPFVVRGIFSALRQPGEYKWGIVLHAETGYCGDSVKLVSTGGNGFRRLYSFCSMMFCRYCGINIDRSWANIRAGFR
jgi:hypothetical protein